MHEIIRVKERTISWLAIFIVYVVILCTILLINSGFRNACIIAMVAVLAVMLLQNLDTYLVISIMICPFDTILNIPGSYTIMPFVLAVGICKYCYAKGFRLSLDSRFLIAFCVVLIQGIVISLVRYGSCIETISASVLYFFVYLYASDKRKESTDLFDYVANAYLIGIIVYCACTNLFPNVAKNVTNIPEYTLRNYGFNDVWAYGQYLAVAMAFCLVQMKARKLNYLLGIGMLALFIYYLIQTGLYTGLFGFAVLVVLFTFSFDGMPRQRLIRTIIAFMCLIAIGAFMLKIILPQMINIRQGQFGDNGRIELWQMYINAIFTKLDVGLFGVGNGCINLYASQINQFTTHNVIIEKLVEFGIPCFIVFVYMLRRICHGTVFNIRKNNHIIVLFVMLATLMTQGVSGNELPFLLIPITIFSQDAIAASNCKNSLTDLVITNLRFSGNAATNLEGDCEKNRL